MIEQSFPKQEIFRNLSDTFTVMVSLLKVSYSRKKTAQIINIIYAALSCHMSVCIFEIPILF